MTGPMPDELAVRERVVGRITVPPDEVDAAVSGLAGVTVTRVDRESGVIEFETVWSEPQWV